MTDQPKDPHTAWKVFKYLLIGIGVFVGSLLVMGILAGIFGSDSTEPAHTTTQGPSDENAAPTQPTVSDQSPAPPTERKHSLLAKSPASCSTCIMQQFYPNQDSMNKDCYDKTVTCLLEIAQDRITDGQEDPMCNEDGKECLCVGQVWNGWTEQCYKGLARGLCTPALTDKYCKTYESYLPDSGEIYIQQCKEEVDASCRKPGTTVESLKILRCENQDNVALKDNCYAYAAHTERNDRYCQLLSSNTEAEHCEKFIQYDLLVDQIKKSGTQSDCEQIDPQFEQRSLGKPYQWCVLFFDPET